MNQFYAKARIQPKDCLTLRQQTLTEKPEYWQLVRFPIHGQVLQQIDGGKDTRPWLVENEER